MKMVGFPGEGSFSLLLNQRETTKSIYMWVVRDGTGRAVCQLRIDPLAKAMS